jgi:acyl-coenzyme A thioesterase PaaI-like protein
LLTDGDHGNPNGIVHGGVLMAFADHSLSFLAWEAAGRAQCTTIQLNTHFLDAIRLGEFIELHGEITRRTPGLVFVRGVIGARDHNRLREVGAVDGIWRVLRSR